MSNVEHGEETIVKVNGIEICYDTFGDSTNPTMLLVMGLGSQMVLWEEAFCEELAKTYYVVRFDNRDVGLSTKLDDAGIPNPMELMMTLQQGESIKVPYLLKDMADDAIGLLDALKIKTAHVVGASMGGMIVQTMAINHPDRINTLTSIMSSTGNPELPQPEPEALEILTATPPDNRDEYIEESVKAWQFLNGPKYPLDEERIKERSGLVFDRCYYPAGSARQLAAILASGSRKEDLKKVKIPTLVIHGKDDPLVPVEGGKDTVESIPGAKLMIIEGMGHNIPPQVAPRIIEAITQHAR
ncbi:MAG: alpha/beta fold hydrolase [Candidatus Hodarchaeales archaeon]|jgi:pimeloyl-ACP methyl ester carboxylesterase